MRSIILDTETTGISARRGDRIIEIGAVEAIDLVPTGRIFHAYLDPQAPIHWAASKVHGLRNADLAGFPFFRDILPSLLEFCGDARIYAHNAPFDRGFIDAEFDRCRCMPPIPSRWTCTLPIVKRRSPGGSAGLDTVAARLGIETPDRRIHGALLDAAILAAVMARLHDAPEVDIAALTALGKPFPGRKGTTTGPAKTPGPARSWHREAYPAAREARSPASPPAPPVNCSRTAEARRILAVTAAACRDASDILDFVARVEAGGIRVRPNVLQRTGELHGMRFAGPNIHMTTADAGFDGVHFSEGPLAYDIASHRKALLENTGSFDRDIGNPSTVKGDRMSANTFDRGYKVAYREATPDAEPEGWPTP